TYLGGEGQDHGSGIAVDTAGNAYITGYTGSRNFPVANGLQPTLLGSFNAFVAKLDATGAKLAYSTYLRRPLGAFGRCIALDATGNVHLTGVTSSTNFPLAHPLQGTFGGGDLDAFVTKLNAVGTQLIYSTYLGGGGSDRGFRLAVDRNGNSYVAGDTDSANFP